MYVGKIEPGGITVEFDAAKAADAAGKYIETRSESLPEPYKSLGIGIGTILSSGALYGIGRIAANRARDRADAAYDEGRTVGTATTNGK